MNKRAMSAGLIIMIVILILLLILVVVVFIFNVNIFGDKQEKRELTYKTFLVNVKDKITDNLIDSKIYIYDENSTQLYNLTSHDGVYEKVNLSVDNIYITKKHECWVSKFLFFSWNVCGDKKLTTPIAYSTYCFSSRAEGYYSEYKCMNFTQASQYIPEFALTPSGNIQLISPTYLISDNGVQTYQFKIYISNTEGEFRKGVICVDYSIGIIKAWLDNGDVDKSSFPIPVKRCYNMRRDLNINDSYDFSVYYKSNPLYDNDFIKVYVYDRDYLYPDTNLYYYDNSTDLGAENKYIIITKNG